jgi:acylphosphatase
MLRQRIVFYGWVQGVGFRYWARHAATLYGATGWVRNNPDDTVTMEIQGTQEQIDQVVMALKNGRFINIDRMDVTSLPVIEDERAFRYVI